MTEAGEPVRFVTRVVGETTTGIEVPAEIVESFNSGKRVPVVVTLRGHSYHSTVAPYKGPYMISLSAENRMAAGVLSGDEVEVHLVHDTAPRVVELDADFSSALAASGEASTFFGSLSASQKKAFTYWIGEAKKPETRAARISKAVEMLAEGKRR